MANTSIAPAAAGLTLLDLPPEIRLMIFRFALRTPTGIARRHWHTFEGASPNGEGTKIDISLLLLSRAVFTEAEDAFYLEHTVRLSDSVDTVYGLNGVRRVEIVGEMAASFCEAKVDVARRVAELAQLPKMQHVILQCDTLGETNQSMRELATHAAPNGIHRWTKIGVLEVLLPLTRNVKVTFEYSMQTSFLGLAGQLATQLSTAAIILIGNTRDTPRTAHPILALATWLRYHNLGRAGTRSGSVDFMGAEAFRAYVVFEQLVTKNVTHNVPWVHPCLPLDVKLEDLKVEEPGEELVEWASELLAMNSTNFAIGREMDEDCREDDAHRKLVLPPLVSTILR